MTNRFQQETAVQRLDGSTFAAEACEGWRVINKEVMNGGYVMVLGARAMAERAERPDPVSVTTHYLAPVRPGPVRIVTELVRAGGRHRTVAASIVQHETTCARMIGTFGELPASAGPAAMTATAPNMPTPDDLAPTEFTDPSGEAVQEIFERLEFRTEPAMAGWLRGEPTGRGVQEGWCRWAEGGEMDTMGLLLVADAYPAAVYDLSPAHVTWTPTIELTVHVLARPSMGWLAAHFAAHTAASGYFEEDGRFWDASGCLVATSRQIGLLGR
jgi:acyl-CoA thioesterase